MSDSKGQWTVSKTDNKNRQEFTRVEKAKKCTDGNPSTVPGIPNSSERILDSYLILDAKAVFLLILPCVQVDKDLQNDSRKNSV
jgi:hypothetical protein